LDLSFDELFGRLRAYVPLWRIGHETHVLALQAGAGAAFGPQARLGRFGVGGASGSPEDVTGFTLFGGSFVPLPVRGYESFSRFGRWAWATSAEYRFPIALVNRGLGAWPMHLDRLVGSLFTDVGNAWEPNPRADPLVSVGAELSAQFLVRYDAPILLRTGVALPLVDGSGASVYLRVGLPF
jgi:outer membrane protein assembly factor BamA